MVKYEKYIKVDSDLVGPTFYYQKISGFHGPPYNGL